jgi:hypothetical protein
MYVSLGARLRQTGVALVLLTLAFVSISGGGASAQQPGMRWDGLIELISGRYSYPPPAIEPQIPADGPSTMSRHAISADGRYVLFNSDATNLGYSQPALYLRDRRTGETRVLLAGAALNGTLSADGNHAAFEICDPYSRPQPRPDGAAICDVYTLDVRTWMWTLISATPGGIFGDDSSGAPVLSSNGRFVVFRTKSGNLTGGPRGIWHLVLRDRDADNDGIFDEPGTVQVDVVSVPTGSTVRGNADSDTPEVSDDGRYVSFRSRASNLVPGDVNQAWDVFLRDRVSRQTRRINLRGGFQESPESIDSPQISMTPDGHYIAYASADPVLAPSSSGDANGTLDVFVYDAVSRVTSRVDIGYGPPFVGMLLPGNGPTSWPTLSADGRYVALQSAATNGPTPTMPGSVHSYVVDRSLQQVSRVSVRPDGVDPDHDAVTPGISADGSVVTFVSQAFNLTPPVYTDADRIYAAVHFELTPSEVLVPGGGGSATFTVTTQQHTQWWMDWTEWMPWWQIDAPPFGVGNGEIRLRVTEPNPDPTRRSYTVRAMSQTALVTQLEGMSLTSISPNSGPATGGTRVTLTGTGFEPGARVVFDGYEAVTEFVSSTTLIATTAAHAPATVWVAVFSMDARQNAWIDQAFRYTDTTPPQVFGWTSGEQGNSEWFTGDATVSFGWWDPESTVTSTTGCNTVVVSANTPGSTFTCSAASEGGTASASVTVKRDATPPAISISAPAARQLFKRDAPATSTFTCSDPTSGIAQCGISTASGAPIDTSTPGWHSVIADAIDVAGNIGVASVEYAVPGGACVADLPDIVGWWRMEGNTRNTRSNVTSQATPVGLTSDVYVDAMAGQGYQFEGANGYLDTLFAIRIAGDLKFGVGAWVKPSANTYGTILRKKDQYSVARTSSGTIAWAFRKFNNPTISYYDTGVVLPLNVWSHVVVVLDRTEVRTYLNGRLAHTATAIGDVYTWDNMYETITLGGAQDRGEYFKGVLDEVQVYLHGLTADQIEQLFLAGPAGACPPKATQFSWTAPIQASYGSSTYRIEIALRDDAGQPVVNRSVRLESIVGAQPYSTSVANRVTDSNGLVTWDAPLKNAPPGTYEDFVSATFNGDNEYVRAYAEPTVIVNKATPSITWTTPTPITYGTAIGSSQLNATASVTGTMTYSPASGSVPPAGAQTLTATFMPSNTTYYTTATASVTQTVNKATPMVTVAGGTFVYDGQPHIATGSVRGVGDVMIGSPSFTYNGSPDAPMNAGTYDVVATFDGNANYNAASATGTITIGKAPAGLTWSPPAAIVHGTPLGAAQLNATANVDGTFAYTPAAGTVLDAAAGQTLTATFTPTDSTNYNGASITTTIDVSKAAPVLTWSTPAAIAFGTPLGLSQLNVTSSTPGSFVYTPAAGTVLNAGSGHALSAQFTPADATNYTEGSVSTTIEVTKAAATVSVTSGTFTYDGQPHVATGTVTGAGGAALGPLTLTYNGQSGAPVNAGTYAVVGSFAGDANHEAASGTATLVIGKASPVLGWSAPGAVGYGTPLGGAQLAATSSVAGSFVYAPAAGTVLAAGSHTLAATFVPADAVNYAGGTVGTAIAVAPAPLTVGAGDASKPFGAPLPAPGATFAGFVNGDTPASLSGTLGFATPATQQSPVGTYPIVPGGVSSPNYSITFLNGALLVVKGGVAVTAGTSPEPSGLGQAMTFTATLSAAAPAAGTPGGLVEFYDGSILIGTATMAGNTATLTTAGLAAGTHAIEARYSGDASFLPGTGASSHVVKNAASTPTMSVTSSRNPSSTGQSVTVTANISMSAGAVAGSIQFWDGGTLLGTSTISAGRATLTTSTLANGTHAITARYLGSASAPPAVSGVLVQAVGGTSWKNRTTTATVASSANPSTLENAVTFTATIVGSSSSVPTGRVLFMVNGNVVGDPAGVAVTLVSGTTVRAVLPVPGLAHGSHQVTVTYLGDINYKGSTATVTQTVN